MHLDPLMPDLMVILLVTIAVTIAMKKFKQPGPIAHIIVGLLVGSSFLGIIDNPLEMSRIGDYGIVFLIFFMGLEIDVRDITANWKLSVLGTLLQVSLSIIVAMAGGVFFHWGWRTSILIGFILTLSSTAMVVNVLNSTKVKPNIKNDVVTILISQDLAIVPMMMVMSFISDQIKTDFVYVFKQALGGFLLVLALFLARRFKQQLTKVFGFIQEDRELQVFAALFICFSFAFIASFLQLSSALGAFFAGIIVSSLGQKEWIIKRLEPLKVILLGIFFLSIGSMINLDHFRNHWGVVLFLVMLSLSVNTTINFFMLKTMGRSYEDSIYSAALLAQIGEFGFVLSTIGRDIGILDGRLHQNLMTAISITMVLTPVWVLLAVGIAKVINREAMQNPH